MTTNQVVINQEMEKWVVVTAIRNARAKRRPDAFLGLGLFLGFLPS
ncbi:hypothetical protein HORM4_430040 [Vibrio harveyi]|jgi:hypothetical protein|uniref:Glutamate-1-semialdehyde aminotransferase n=1 Tax=Vibrio harveyi TaxID=669 RepID=A0A454CUF0_VIBHA|nr:glutamate-1-semialdehyde aminotransferase [Vibrio harveyi]CAK6714273.1 hypothetical protein HORM4_430040 [Vibrio harveyi]